MLVSGGCRRRATIGERDQPGKSNGCTWTGNSWNAQRARASSTRRKPNPCCASLPRTTTTPRHARPWPGCASRTRSTRLRRSAPPAREDRRPAPRLPAPDHGGTGRPIRRPGIGVAGHQGDDRRGRSAQAGAEPRRPRCRRRGLPPTAPVQSGRGWYLGGGGAHPRQLRASQTCHACGRRQKKPLKQRHHACACGASCSRDANAARVLLAWTEQWLAGREPAEAWREVSPARPPDGPAFSAKRETPATA